MFRTTILFAILALTASLLSAKTMKHGDWSWGTSPDLSYTFSGTMNADGSVLSKYCYVEGNGNCYFIVSSSVSCEHGEDLPAVINTGAMQQVATMTCAGHFNNKYQFVLSPYKRVKHLLLNEETSEFNIMFGHDVGTLHTQHYSAKGVHQAIQGMELFFTEIYRSVHAEEELKKFETL